MSKLDEVLYRAAPELTDVEHIKLREQIKALYLELIGGDVQIPTGGRAAGKTIAYVGNSVRAELRKKVEEL